jgi:hypothetical protein
VEVMAENKKSFIIYTSWKRWLDGLNLEQKGKWLDWMLSYTNDENPQFPSDQAVMIACMMAQDTLKRDLKKYEAKVERIKSARNQNPNNNKELLENNNQTDISMKSVRNQYDIGGVNVNVNDNVNVNVNDNVLSKDNELNNRDINISCAKEEKNESIFESFWKVYPRKIGKEKCKNWFKSHKPKEDLVKQMIEAVEQQKKSKQWSDPQYIPHPYTWLNQGRWEDELTPTKDSTFQSAPKNPIQWEEAKANTIEDDINLIRNNPDRAYQLLNGIEKINPERAKEIRRILRM